MRRTDDETYYACIGITRGVILGCAAWIVIALPVLILGWLTK